MILCRGFSCMIIVSLLCLCPCFARSEAIVMDEVLLRALDKVTGRTTNINLKIGQEERFGSLKIKAFVCKTNSPEDTPENAAFLQLVDVGSQGNRADKLFSGWMFSSSPALSALESPLYDVWVLKCSGNEVKEGEEMKEVNAEREQNQVRELDEIYAEPPAKSINEEELFGD